MCPQVPGGSGDTSPACQRTASCQHRQLYAVCAGPVGAGPLVGLQSLARKMHVFYSYWLLWLRDLGKALTAVT